MELDLLAGLFVNEGDHRVNVPSDLAEVSVASSGCFREAKMEH